MMRLSLKQFVAAVCFMLFVAAAPADAGVRHGGMHMTAPVQLGYDVYAGGLHALTASFGLDISDEDYKIEVAAHTKGFIGGLFPWKARMSATGTAEDGGLKPYLYRSQSSWDDDLKVTELEYAPDGTFKEKREEEDNRKKTKSDFKEKLTRDTVDILTGAITMLQKIGDSEKCEGKVPVFDGKRRFNLTFTPDGVDTLNPSKYSVFKGQALRCTVLVEPVAGFRKKDEKRGWLAIQNHTKERNKLPTIWLARLEEGGPLMPVRMEIASTYGTVIAHLTAKKELLAARAD